MSLIVPSRQNRAFLAFVKATNPMIRLTTYQEDGDNAIEFEDTYDGLGDQLEETGDDFNDDTFGGGGNSMVESKPVGNDYDFFGRTATISDAISKDQARFNSQKLDTKIDRNIKDYSQSLSKPAKSDYERLAQPDYVPEMLVDASIWGVNPKRAAVNKVTEPPTARGTAPDGRKMMSLEEFEASMLSQAKKTVVKQVQGQQKVPEPTQRSQSVAPRLQYQQQYQHYFPKAEIIINDGSILSPQEHIGATSAKHLGYTLQRSHQSSSQVSTNVISSTNNTLRNSNRSSFDHIIPLNVQNTGFYNSHPGSRHFSQPLQYTNLPDDEKAARLTEDAKREKRNHKIFLLSKDNGLMTPQDKNFIKRIQLQQIVIATGNPNEHGIDSSFTEDFYYQVHNQIHGGQLQSMENTYYLQPGGRYGGMRKQIQGSSSHMQQMEQQVQRAVEAAKNRPKNKQTVIEGSLGRISFSNAKTPKTLLNIKSPEGGTEAKTAYMTRDRKAAQASVSGCDRKTVLTDIENVYNTLMLMEDHDRQIPPPINENVANDHLVTLHNQWREKAQKLNKRLWHQLKVHEPIGATTTHPFIAFLSFGKGMKSVPRVFRHISQEQRTTILTMIVLHLDQLDLVRQGLPNNGETQLNAEIREKIELFSISVMPPLFSFLNETGLDIVTGILGLLLTINVDLIARTRIGVSMLTMILSRAGLLKQAGTVNEKQEWDQWTTTYNSFFDALEPTLSNIFPCTVQAGEDFYVWQFLAAIGIGASPTQQRRLVIAVKDRVMETVSLAKTLSPEISSQRLANVNLFMRSIGLDVELLE